MTVFDVAGRACRGVWGLVNNKINCKGYGYGFGNENVMLHSSTGVFPFRLILELGLGLRLGFALGLGLGLGLGLRHDALKTSVSNNFLHIRRIGIRRNGAEPFHHMPRMRMRM